MRHYCYSEHCYWNRVNSERWGEKNREKRWKSTKFRLFPLFCLLLLFLSLCCLGWSKRPHHLHGSIVLQDENIPFCILLIVDNYVFIMENSQFRSLIGIIFLFKHVGMDHWWVPTYREGVEEDTEEEDNKEEDDEKDDKPLETPPQDELECFIGGGEPQEGGLWAPERTDGWAFVCMNVQVCVVSVRDPLRLLQVRVHVGFVSAEAGWSLFLLLFRHDLQSHLHLPLDTERKTRSTQRTNRLWLAWKTPTSDSKAPFRGYIFILV